MKKMILALLALVSFSIAKAQKADFTDPSTSITWLGLDFTQLKFIGDAAQWKDAGEITNSAMRDKYFPSWNELFVKEQKKFDVAKAVHHESVTYELDVTEKANNSLKSPNFFTDDANAYKRLEEKDITGLVKKYNFQGKSGVGLLFFVESMSKGKEEAAMWVTFVDMKSKSVLATKRMTGAAGGFGFRNYWAKPFSMVLKELDKNFSSWK